MQYMIPARAIIVSAFIFLLLNPVTNLHAESPREQLNALVVQLQGNPGDNTLREQIIKLVQGLDPPPAVPEEARRAFVQGTTIAKEAKNPEQQALAVQSYQDALKIAPWWGDAYYNLALAQELAGQLDAAQSSFKLYILTNPGEKEARDAQDRIYALEAKAKLAVVDSTQQQAAQEKDASETILHTIDGALYGFESTFPDENGAQFVFQYFSVEVHGHQATYKTYLALSPGDITIYTCVLNGTNCDLQGWDDPSFRQTLSFSSDGNSVTSTEYLNGNVVRTVTLNRR